MLAVPALLTALLCTARALVTPTSAGEGLPAFSTLGTVCSCPCSGEGEQDQIYFHSAYCCVVFTMRLYMLILDLLQ